MFKATTTGCNHATTVTPATSTSIMKLSKYLKNSAAVAFWSKVEARYSQVKRIYDQARVQAQIESAILQNIKENEPEIGDKNTNKNKKLL
ncbi:hypothetical protein RMATCC62417_17225 [Rhizopus microsporus]|nr:hypothetical protein RMATCC62417_17225 [Rhizopus microsporus]